METGKPLVSIIIPVYNVEKYLPQCLDSLLAQTLQQIEVICINDCSPDNSIDILNEYARKDARIKVIELPENRRQGGAGNADIRTASADWIGFVDSDDWVSTEMILSEMNEIMPDYRKYPAYRQIALKYRALISLCRLNIPLSIAAYRTVRYLRLFRP